MLFDSLLYTLEKELRASLDTCVMGMVATARTQLEATLAEVAKERAKGLAEVARERAELRREIKAMQMHKEAQEGRVELNIGGWRFETSVQTLRRVPQSFFDAYFSGRYAQDVCADGSIFVDRDGERFGLVLEFMRDGVVSVAAQEASELDVSLLRALKREFGFYCIELMAEPEEVVFVVGGVGGNNSSISLLERYDITSGTWQPGAKMSSPRFVFGLCQFSGQLYAIGGLYQDDDIALASVECYNPTLDTWSAAPALPRGRSSHCACTVGDTMFVLGGVEKIAGDAELLETRSVLKFDSGTQAWSEVEPMLRALSNCSTCVLGSNIFVLGGFDGEKSVESTFCYNTLTNLWKTLAPMPGAKMGPSICVLSGLIYTIGGSTTMNHQYASAASSVHRFDPAANL
jgi:N-acetylneuraminic acid mutarotase